LRPDELPGSAMLRPFRSADIMITDAGFEYDNRRISGF
jgi:hypothetical protein